MSRCKRVLPLLLIVAVFAAFALRNGHELREAGRLLCVARVIPLLGAMACQALYYVFAALTVRQCLRLVDFRLPFRESLRATFLLIFVSRIVPGPAATGPAAMYVILGRRGLDRTRSMFVGPVFYAVDYAAFFVLLLAGVLGQMLRHQDIRIAAAAIPVAAVAAVIAWTVAGMWRRPERMQCRLERWRGIANRVLPARLRIPERASMRAADEMREMRDRMNAHPGIGAKLAAAGLAMLLCDVATMAFCFVAFGYVPAVATALLGFCLATVGAILSFLPGGLGTFEAAMVFGFVSLGAPKSVAVAATVAYRVIATWLPALLGLASSGEMVRTARKA